MKIPFSKGFIKSILRKAFEYSSEKKADKRKTAPIGAFLPGAVVLISRIRARL